MAKIKQVTYDSFSDTALQVYGGEMVEWELPQDISNYQTISVGMQVSICGNDGSDLTILDDTQPVQKLGLGTLNNNFLLGVKSGNGFVDVSGNNFVGLSNFGNDGPVERLDFKRPLFPATDDFDFSVTFNLNTLTAIATIFSQYAVGFEGRCIISVNAGVPQFWIGHSSGNLTINGSSVTAGQDHTIRVTRQGTTFTLYLDGNFVASDTASYSILQTSTIIGHTPDQAYDIDGSISSAELNGKSINISSKTFFGVTTGGASPRYIRSNIGETASSILSGNSASFINFDANEPALIDTSTERAQISYGTAELGGGSHYIPLKITPSGNNIVLDYNNFHDLPSSYIQTALNTRTQSRSEFDDRMVNGTDSMNYTAVVNDATAFNKIILYVPPLGLALRIHSVIIDLE